MIAPALALLSALAASAPHADAPARYVIAVGYNGASGDDRRQELSFADDDAARMFLQLLPGAERGWLLTTFDDESARAFGPLSERTRPPTSASLARTLGEASWAIRKAHDAGRETELVFFFAGHGDVDASGTGFLVLADGPFTRRDLATQVVSASPADLTHVVLDACASYFMVPRGGDGKRSAAIPLGDALGTLMTDDDTLPDEVRARTGYFVSTSSAAPVHESAELGGGLFSYLLRSALAGAADSNGDGRVEYTEAAAFLAAAGDGIDDPRARLRVFSAPPAQRPHVPLADLAASGAEHFLVVDEDRPVRLRILDDKGAPYAELHRAPADAPTFVALVGRPYFVVQDGDEEAVLVPRAAGAVALSSLDFAPRPKGRGVDHGPFAGVFQTAYDDAFLRGYLSRTSAAPPLDGPRLAIGYAPGSAPPFEVPWWTLAGSSFAAAGVFAAGAVAASAANALSLAALRQRFEATGTLDPDLALQTDAWLTAAGGLGVAAVSLVVVGGGLSFFALQEDR